MRAVDTRIVQVDEQHKAGEILRQAGELIKAGGLVAFPTETVYGLGGDALNPDSSRKIYEAKGRPSDNPLIVHICRMEDLSSIVEEIPEAAEKLAAAFWPGPLTMIFKKTKLVPPETTGGLATVAVRMPLHPTASALIAAAGGYIAAPSANLSGKPSPTSAKYVIEDLMGRVDMIIDGGDVEIGLESTIVDMTEEEPMILRPGYITKEMLEDVLQSVGEDKTMMSPESGQRPKAPGMKYRHYAPKGELTIVEGEIEAVTAYINGQTEHLQKEGHKVGVVGTDATIARYKGDVCKSAGSRTDEKTIAQRLYRILREFDDENVTVIFSESFDSAGIGQAIMNRLLKAAGHRVVQV
ncbi:MAG: L-threonylcarbamoyladenylate synthase [Bacillus sp. (in: Bacteria)]|nr:L-threonylcarbamoyladenylate synthase [Bacillus sp. (in: firmicutes)]MCM1425279.1 L-threonylcarbamoyladenylate synthase [Eubacterium sp.]